MKKLLLSIFCLVVAAQLLLAQTAGEQESFEAMKTAAATYMKNGDYSAAKAQYEGIFRLYRQYESFTKEISSDYEKCLRELDKAAATKKESERLTFSEPFVNFPYSADSHTLTIVAGRGGSAGWTVESSPEWCQYSKDGNKLILSVDANPDPTLRNGEISISMKVSGKVVTRDLAVLQVARPLEERSVRILTEPEGAQITIGNDPTPRTTPVTVTLKEGDTPVHIMRQDYFSLDTFISVSAADDSRITKEYRFELVPRFSVARIDVKTTAGKLEDKNPRLFIGDRQINLDGYYGRSSIKAFNATGGYISRFEIYQDNNRNFIIPLEPATYTVTMTADDFEDYNYTFTVREGETVPLDILMTPKRGTVRFFNGRNADGVMIKDGTTPIGTMGDQFEVQMTADDHKIYFEKENYMPETPYYSIHVSPGQTLDIEVNMDPLSYINIISDPAGAEVFVNGVSEGMRTPVMNKAVPLGENTITLGQSGYYPATVVHRSGVVGGSDSINISLKESHPLRISSDAYRSSWCSATGFNIYLKSVEGQEPAVYEYDRYTDTVMDLPYGKYKVEFRRHSQGPDPGYINGVRIRSERRKNDLAYKGVFRFDEKHSSLHRMSYSEDGCFAVLSGNYNLTGFEVFSGSEAYSNLGDVGFMKFPLWPGFSSNLARGSVFKANNASADPQYFFSATCLLLNGEQRIGGSILPYLDLNFLASYAWLPQLHTRNWSVTEGMAINYVDGHDVFIGVELSSRLPSINANFKFGYKLASGHVNRYDKTEKEYLSTPYDFSGISASVGFTFGSRDCKGANTLRVFYL